MSVNPPMTDVLRFMEVRAPFSPEAKSLEQNYIRDDFIGVWNDKRGRYDSDLQIGASVIGRLVYQLVFCGLDGGDPVTNVNNLITAVLQLLTPYQAMCPPSAHSDKTKPLYRASWSISGSTPGASNYCQKVRPRSGSWT